jgi:hypothetical protein
LDGTESGELEKMTKAKWIGALGALATTVMAPAAFADSGLGTTGQGYGTVGALLGFGTADYSVFSLGARGGYTLPMNVYLGGRLQYNFGTDDFHSFEFGFEGGYDLDVGPVVIRPYLGLGDDIIGFSASRSVTFNGITVVGGASGSSSYFALWPGGTVMYPIQNFFVGGDVRFMIVPSAPDGLDSVAFNVYATGGLQF